MVPKTEPVMQARLFFTRAMPIVSEAVAAISAEEAAEMVAETAAAMTTETAAAMVAETAAAMVAEAAAAAAMAAEAAAVMEAEDVLSKLYFIDTNLMCKNRSWAWVAKIGDRQTGACYFVSEVLVLKATLCATSVAQILITYPTKMGMVVTSSRVHSRRNSRSGISIK